MRFNGLQSAFLILLVVSAVMGWVVIETILWLFSFVSVTIGA